MSLCALLHNMLAQISSLPHLKRSQCKSSVIFPLTLRCPRHRRGVSSSLAPASTSQVGSFTSFGAHDHLPVYLARLQQVESPAADSQPGPGWDPQQCHGSACSEHHGHDRQQNMVGDDRAAACLSATVSPSSPPKQSTPGWETQPTFTPWKTVLAS